MSLESPPLLSWHYLEEVFPFLFAWDADSRVCRVGPSLVQVIGTEVLGQKLEAIFHLQRPGGQMEAAHLVRHPGQLILIRHEQTGMMLRGQVLDLKEAGLGVFLGSPWLSSPDDLERFGLSLTDFAPHDAAQDLLHVVQAHKGANRELHELNSKLKVKQRQLIEKELEARKLALVAERTDNSVILADREGKIEWVNRAFEQMTGWRMEEVIGQKPGAFLQGPSTDPAIVTEMGDLLRAGEGFRTEILNYHRDGTPYWVDIEVQPILSPEGEVLQFMALESDVSDRKRREIRRRLETTAARVIAAPHDLRTIFPALLRGMAEELGWVNAGWWQLAGEGEYLQLEQIWHLEHPSMDEFVARGKSLKLRRGEGLPGEVWETCKSLWLTNVQEAKNFPRRDVAADCGLLAALAFPVFVRGRFRGVMEFFSLHLNTPDPELLECLDHIGVQFGLIIERLEAEAALRKSERALKEAQLIAGLGNWSYAPKTGRIEWSDEKYRIYGLIPQSVPADLALCQKAFHPEDYDRVMLAMNRSVEWQEPLQVNYRIVRPGGEIRHVRAHAVTQHSDDAEGVVLVGTVLDITELVLAQENLRETEERWLLAIQSNGLGIWDWHVQSGEVIYTDRLQEMLGYAAGEWPQHVESWISRVHPEDLPEVKRLIDEYIAGESVEYVCEHRLLCKDGSWKWVQDVGRIVSRNAEGLPLRMIGTQMDIDIRKQAELGAKKRESLLSQLHAAQERYIVSADPTPVFAEMLDIIVKHTESGYGFLGEALQDENGLPYLQAYAVTDLAWDEQTRAKRQSMGAAGMEFRAINTVLGKAMLTSEVVLTNEAVTGAQRGGLPSDHPAIHAFLGLPVYHGLEMIGLIGLANRSSGYQREMLRDLDPFLAAFSSMIMSRREARRLELDQANLREARDRAETASRAKSDFLTMISHEIRTPMNGVIGMARLLCASHLDERQMEMAQAVVNSGMALVGIMNDILDFAKIEAGQIELREQVLAVDDLVEGVADLLAHEAHAKGIEITSLFAPGVPLQVRGDTSRLRQVLLNFTGNAVKFTEQGCVTLRVSYAEGVLELTVEDTGIGLSEKDMERLFTPFTQIDSSATRRYGGAGMGLAICKKLVHRMGGTIGVKSRLGEGSQFTFSVPVATAEGAPAVVSGAGRRRIWIADKDACVRESIAAALQGSEHEFQQMATPAELVQALRSGTDAPDGLVVNAALLDGQVQDAITAWLAATRGVTALPRRIVVTTSLHEKTSVPTEWPATVLRRPLHRKLLREAIFTLPQPLAAAPQAGQHGRDSTKKPLGLKVLVAEDNRVNAQLARMLLENLGCTPWITSNGQEAVTAFQEQDFDVVLMDCQMPVLDGYEATQSIRAIEAQKGPSARRCPIIAMTAAVGALERQRSLEAGMDDHLAKPFDEDKINQILNDVAKMKAATSVPIDPLALAKFETLKKQVGPNAARELATIWLEDVHDRVKRLKEAFHAGLFEVVRKEGHALKGGCTIFSMDDVINACTALEKNIRDEGVPSLHLVEVIVDQVESAAMTLHRIISGEETASPG